MKSKGFIMELIDTHAHLFLMKDSPDVIWQNAQKAQNQTPQKAPQNAQKVPQAQASLNNID